MKRKGSRNDIKALYPARESRNRRYVFIDHCHKCLRKTEHERGFISHSFERGTCSRCKTLSRSCSATTACSSRRFAAENM